MEDSYVLHLRQQYQIFTDLYLCYCGYAYCEPLHSYGPAVRPNYLLHYIMSGKGIYQIDGATHTLGKGEGFLIEPNKQTFYQADVQEPWSYLWIGFDGSNVERCLRTIGLDGEHLHTVELLQLLLGILQFLHVPSGDDEIGPLLGKGGGNAVANGAAAGAIAEDGPTAAGDNDSFAFHGAHVCGPPCKYSRGRLGLV